MGNPSRTQEGMGGKGLDSPRRPDPLWPPLSGPSLFTTPRPSPHYPALKGDPHPPRSFTLTRLCMWLRHSRCTRRASSASSSNTSPSTPGPRTQGSPWIQDITEATTGQPGALSAVSPSGPRGGAGTVSRGGQGGCSCACALPALGLREWVGVYLATADAFRSLGFWGSLSGPRVSACAVVGETGPSFA